MNSQRPTSRRARLGALAVAGLAAAFSLVAVARASATSTTGILNAKMGANQAFGVQRSPAFPTCTAPSTYNSWTVSSPTSPYSDSSGGPVTLGTNYLMVFDSGDTSHPWGLRMYNASGDELRWNGSAWKTAAQVGGTFTTEKPFAEKGQIYGVSSDGFLHNSYPQLFGTFFSPNSVLTGSRSYTPDSALNSCELENSQYRAIGANLGSLSVNNTPIGPPMPETGIDTSRTIAVALAFIGVGSAILTRRRRTV